VRLTGVGGITFSDPCEWDVVLGIQYALFENVKLIGEYRHHKFEEGNGSQRRLRREGRATLPHNECDPVVRG
jgi:hypothetical protein